MNKLFWNNSEGCYCQIVHVMEKFCTGFYASNGSRGNSGAGRANLANKLREKASDVDEGGEIRRDDCGADKA